MEGKQLFRKYDIFNQNTFLDYLKQIKKSLGKVILVTDIEHDSTFQSPISKYYRTRRFNLDVVKYLSRKAN